MRRNRENFSDESVGMDANFSDQNLYKDYSGPEQQAGGNGGTYEGGHGGGYSGGYAGVMSQI